MKNRLLSIALGDETEIGDTVLLDSFIQADSCFYVIEISGMAYSVFCSLEIQNERDYEAFR